MKSTTEKNSQFGDRVAGTGAEVSLPPTAPTGTPEPQDASELQSWTPATGQAAHTWYAEQHDTPLNRRGNLPTRIWGHMRQRVNNLRNDAGIKTRIRNLQAEWIGDLSGKRVLDLGCGVGNTISLKMAREADDYLAFDLSEPAIATLRQKLDQHELHNAQCVAGDFLAEDFPYGTFDVVYANSILHHIDPLERILKLTHARMNDNGLLVLMDPMQTSPLVWSIRHLFHTFRSDRNWNWPFTRASFRIIDKFFDIEAVRGFYGATKWAVPLTLTPVTYPLALGSARFLDGIDERLCSRPGLPLWGCLSVTMALRRKPLRESEAS